MSVHRLIDQQRLEVVRLQHPLSDHYNGLTVEKNENGFEGSESQELSRDWAATPWFDLLITLRDNSGCQISVLFYQQAPLFLSA